MTVRDENGFTLIELLLTVVITGIIIVALGESLLVGIRNTDDVTKRISDSRDAQLTARYFVADVQSSDAVLMTDAPAPCGDPAAGYAPVARFTWTDQSVAKTALYVAQTVGTEKQLIRRYCEAGSLVGTVVVAHALGATNPAMTCVPGPACGATPSSVAMSVTLTPYTGFIATSPYQYSVSASRRRT